MYIYYLISIDLQLSRLFNSSRCKAYINFYIKLNQKAVKKLISLFI